MSCDSGSDTSKKWSHQFGLYRQAEKTHESFVKLSRRRQRRLGCICLLASILVIISIIVALLMIYDYAIIVESTIKHKKVQKEQNKSITENLPTDLPDEIELNSFREGAEKNNEKMGSSEKLNRRSLDSDLSRIPQLINDLQEKGFPNFSFEEYNSFLPNLQPKTIRSNFMDPAFHHNQHWRPIKKSPSRPHLFEYKSATPTSFQKAKMYSTWLENYRNAQRLKNIEQVIKYLQKNNSKFTELQAAPSTKHVTFSGIYVTPEVNGRDKSQNRFEKYAIDSQSDQNVSDKNRIINGHAYTFDPLFTYKPENPGDVNLLANEKLRFSPSQLMAQTVKPDGVPIFRSILSSRKRNCNGHKCSSEHTANAAQNGKANTHKGNEVLNGFYASKTTEGYNKTNATKTKLLSVMLDIYPMNENDEELMKIPNYLTESTTKHPMFHFRPRPSKPVVGFGPGSNYYFNSKPNQSYKTKPPNQPFHNPYNIKAATYGYNHNYGGRRRFPQKIKVDENNHANNPTQMLVHLNLYPRKKINSSTETKDNTERVVDMKEKKRNVQIIKSDSFDYILNQTEHNLTNVTDISHFPTILENARRINELQLLKPQIIMFGPSDATSSAVSTEDSIYYRRNFKANDPDEQRRISTKLKNDYATTENTQDSIISPINTNSTSSDLLVEEIASIQADNTKNNRIYKNINRINQNSKNINDWVSDDITVTSSTEVINVEDFTTNKLAKLYKTIDRNPKSKRLP